VCTYIEGRDTKRKGQKLDSTLPVGLGVLVQSLDVTLWFRCSRLLLSPTLCWNACEQSLFLFFNLSVATLVFVVIVHFDDASIFFSSMKYSNHKGGRGTRGKLEFFADDDLPS
jgi:hypothetical protein